jgi:hypothetical protein
VLSGIIVSAPVETAEPLDAVLLPVLPIEFEAWLRAALAVAEPAVEADAADVEQAPLVSDAVTMVDAAGVAVDEVMGAKVEDDVLDVEDVLVDGAGVVAVEPARTAVGRLRDDDGVVAATEPSVGKAGAAVAEDVPDDVAEEVEVDDEVVVVVVVAVVDEVVEDEATAEAGEQAVTVVTVVAGGPETVPAVALVVCVPLAVPPDVLMKMDFRMSAFCQYCGAASITT